MKAGLELYTDYLCTRVGQIIQAGVAAVFGNAADIENWSVYDYYTPYPIYTMTGKIAGANAFVLSGGAALYSNAVFQTIPYGANIETDTSSNAITTPDIYNPFFMYHDAESEKTYCIQIYATNENGTEYGVRISAYTQTPDTNRTTWYYYSDYMDYQLSVYLRSQDVESNQNQIKVYRVTISDNTYYIFAFGVSADGTYSVGSSVSNGSYFIAIPTEYFSGKIPDNYAGSETEDNSESAYTPTIPYRGDILSRDLTDKRNPYGFNQGNGLALCVITYEEYAAILQGIYAGTAESILNKISQHLAQVIGGNTHRPADEVNAITKAILCCHMVPQITGYISGSHTLKTIAGYHILGGNGDSATTLSLWNTSNTLFHYDSEIAVLSRRLNCYLDFEPYTTIKLHLPFMPVVDIPPSLLWGNGLQLHYTIDIYTGILSCDVIIYDYGNASEKARHFVLTTMQTNCKTDIPIMGNAAQAGIFGGLASAIVGTMGGDMGAGAFGLGLDVLSKISTGNAAGKMSVDGIGAYMSNRTPSLIITRPQPSNPKGFLELQGGTANLGGKVRDFEGYSEFATVELTGIAATEQEKLEIETALKGGVFV